jgi:hypothetical protein
LWAIGAVAALGCSSGDQAGGDRNDRPDAPAGGTASAGQSGSEAGAFGAQPMPTPQAGARSAAGTGAMAGRGSECAAITRTAEGKPSPVDIVWIVDGSASMLDETLAVQDNITQFANTGSTMIRSSPRRSRCARAPAARSEAAERCRSSSAARRCR